MSNFISAEDVSDAAMALRLLDTAPEDNFENGARRSSSQSGLFIHWKGMEPTPFVVTHATRAQHAIKRLLDLVLAGVAIVVLLPLLVIVAVTVKLTSRGPIFFRQEREGLNGSLFGALKFRTMKLEDCDESGIFQAQNDDPRVTRIGRFLRQTSIDELPQLVNVLVGEMSLVGPRPHVPGMLASGTRYDRLVPYYRYRLQVLPGITGWAQANGYRGPTTDSVSARARIDHDVAYIQNYSLWLDLKILLLTIRREFITGSGH